MSRKPKCKPRAETVLLCALHMDDGIERRLPITGVTTGIVVIGRTYEDCNTVVGSAFPGMPEPIALNRGFVTSTNRFINRDEAVKLSGQTDLP